MRHDGEVPREIPDSELHSDDLPAVDAEWEEISEFDLTFNGFERREGLGEYANTIEAIFNETGRLTQDLNMSAARNCLFYEQRRWRHIGEAPDLYSIAYIGALIRNIRECVASSAAPDC